ncbi:protein POOR HOMOLOGOUS SYNAPSIS 1-like isoform X1 [Ananas comosus]|uniref:Protein POOR HOMOLOGOUS SYNAPSIS 1-like isoform X1 n=1 Tax=Ananas comosus TaxID=4615 RepID=A0A6P5F3R2_ANACO|nr:protein POOR HOMOLOGOUS SYNAPSIS 1-like isoform X1 [Ananas comosus]
MARASAATHARSGAAAAAHWEVEYARFFNFPRRSPSSSAAAALLRPLRKKKLRSGGTWIAAASAASLRLVARRPASVAVLSVSIGDDVIEEHFVSNLHFSWPQVSRDTQCPIRGSRVVLLSYRDSSNEIQKFAMRFLTGSSAETFVNCVKECSRDTMDILLPGSDFVGDDSSASEYNASSRLHYGYNEMSNSGEAVGINEEQEDLSCQPLLANNIETIFSNFPCSFTEQPNSCANDNGKGAEGQLKLTEEADLKSLVEKYSADASFYDMLLKLDKVIDHLGGDLALS